MDIEKEVWFSLFNKNGEKMSPNWSKTVCNADSVHTDMPPAICPGQGLRKWPRPPHFSLVFYSSSSIEATKIFLSHSYNIISLAGFVFTLRPPSCGIIVNYSLQKQEPQKASLLKTPNAPQPAASDAEQGQLYSKLILNSRTLRTILNGRVQTLFRGNICLHLYDQRWSSDPLRNRQLCLLAQCHITRMLHHPHHYRHCPHPHVTSAPFYQKRKKLKLKCCPSLRLGEI